MEQIIREEWFKDHKATYTKINDELKILEWEKPNSLHMNVRYVMDKNNLYITGDLYSAMFCLTEMASLECLHDYNLYYFMNKLVFAQKGEHSFNSSKAIKEIKEQFDLYYDINLDELDEDNDDCEKVDLLESLLSNAASITEPSEWIDYLKENYYNLDDICDSYSEWLFDVGMETSVYVKAYLIGIKMAYEQLFKKEEDDEDNED